MGRLRISSFWRSNSTFRDRVVVGNDGLWDPASDRDPGVGFDKSDGMDC